MYNMSFVTRQYTCILYNNNSDISIEMNWTYCTHCILLELIDLLEYIS